MSAGFGYLVLGAVKSSVSRLSTLKPGLICCNLKKLRIISPAPTNSMSDKATSATTSRLRVRRPRAPPVEPRPPSLSDCVRSGFEACSAGSKPNTTAVMSDTATTNARTPPSMPASASRGTLLEAVVLKPAIPQSASNSPSAPPAIDNRKLSVSNWRINRIRPAPSAVRIAISRSRVAARASKRLAMFTQAINRTKPTAPSIIRSARRRSGPTMYSCRGDGSAGYACARGGIFLFDAACIYFNCSRSLFDCHARFESRYCVEYLIVAFHSPVRRR